MRHEAVRDRRGFFINRVMLAFIEEGLALRAEGVPASSIEQACAQAGYSVPALALADEVGPEFLRTVRLAVEPDTWYSQSETKTIGEGNLKIPFEDLKERVLFVVALESARCLQEAVVETVAEVNVGTVLGVGYPRWTGGAAQYVDAHPHGPRGFVARAGELASAYGARFTPPPALVERAEAGAT